MFRIRVRCSCGASHQLANDFDPASRVVRREKTRVFIMATLAAPDISAIVLVLAALLDSIEAMPHLPKHRHRHVVAPS